VRIIARARDVVHWYELRKHDVTDIERELFDSSLRTGRRVLEALGVAPNEARERAERFRRSNVRTLEVMHAASPDDESRIELVRAARDELERQFQRDVEDLERQAGPDWHRPDAGR
jgi:glutathione-regulated potassium-efflux system ancillary protein KefC